METYNTKTAVYDVFSANMTIDTNVEEVYHRNEISACKSCQCNCRLCLGGKAPERTEVFCKADAEGFLEELLAA